MSIDRQALERTLKTVQKAQEAYWAALEDLEEYTGLDLRRPDAEIEHMTVDEVLELVAEQEADVKNILENS